MAIENATSDLLKELARLVYQNQKDWLKDHQSKFCSACPGQLMDTFVYKSPAAYTAGQILEILKSKGVV